MSIVTSERLIEIIEQAFAGTPFPHTTSLRQARLADDWEDDPVRVRRAVEADHVGSWLDVPDADLAAYGNTFFSYSDPPSAHFYLPAFLCFALRQWRKAEDDLLSHILHY